MTPREEQVAFYMHIGLAITQWSHVEDSVRNIMAGAVHDDLNRKAINVGYFSIDGFRAKMDFAEAFVHRMLASNQPDKSKDWTALIDRVRRASFHRNKLAHWRVVTYAETNRAGRRYALEHPIQRKKDLRKHKGKPKPGALCLRDVVKMRHEFYAVTCALQNFLARLAGKQTPFPESDERPSNPPSIEKLRRQIHEGLRFRDRPGYPEQ